MSHKLKNGRHTGRRIDRLLTGTDGNQHLISFRLKMKINMYAICQYCMTYKVYVLIMVLNVCDRTTYVTENALLPKINGSTSDVTKMKKWAAYWVDVMTGFATFCKDPV